MKTRMLIILLVAVLAMLTAYSWRQSAAGAEVPAIDRLNDAAWLSKTLDLTPAQVAQISRLREPYKTALASCCMQHCEARNKLGAELFRPDAKKEQVQALIETMCHAQAQSDVATYEHLLQLRQILTPGQWQKLSGLIQDCLCKACPMGM
jgi:Spy/CpxP family protein refolding chaperone